MFNSIPTTEEVSHISLADLITLLFICGGCGKRFDTADSDSRFIRCKSGNQCPCAVLVNREQACRLLCDEVARQITELSGGIGEAVRKSVELEAHGDADVDNERDVVRRQLDRLAQQIENLSKLAKKGSEKRAALNRKLRACRAHAAELTIRKAHLERQIERRKWLEPGAAEQILSCQASMLRSAALGLLGAEVIYGAFQMIKGLTGAEIRVNAVEWSSANMPSVQGVFRFQRHVVVDALLYWAFPGINGSHDVTFWLRPPPCRDQIAKLVQPMIDLAGMTLEETADQLRAEGLLVTPENVWNAYRHHYETLGLPAGGAIRRFGRISSHSYQWPIE